MLAAGFPCIDVSRAGLRRGLDGPVSSLQPATGTMVQYTGRQRHRVTGLCPWGSWALARSCRLVGSVNPRAPLSSRHSHILSARPPLLDNPLHPTQSTGLVRHVFRLLERAAADHRPVPWVLLENVRGRPYA
jgi:hypothetical protein